MENRCFACMNIIEGNHCDRCGNDNGDLSDILKQQLKPGIIIRDRFYIGLVIEHNGEGMTYVAYDLEEKKRVRIREFFPDPLCFRKADGITVGINQGCEIQYKSLLTDFAELSKQLIDLKSNHCLLRAKMIFAKNETLYTVYEDVAGMTFTRYLIENAGELSWEETENLFLPLLYTVKLLNSNGIIHRGISPETILVTKNNELKLTGVCISAVRAINSEIKPELFIGYAAPEQYQKCISYGEWTDVYSLSAVLYKALTGTMPPRSDMRDVDHSLMAPIQLNPRIPVAVSEAIVRGLAYEKEYRTYNVKQLIGALYSSQQNDEIEEINVKSNTNKKHKLPLWLTVILISFPIMLIAFFLMYYLVLGRDNKPKASSSNTSSIVSSVTESSKPDKQEKPSSNAVPVFSVDNFEGMYYNDIMNATSNGGITYKDMFTFKKVEEFSDTAEMGIVTKQSIAPNESKPKGTEIELTVSKGAQKVNLPPIVDPSGNPIKLEDYKKFLTDHGIESVVERVDSSEVPSGHVVKLSQPPESEVDRAVITSITIYVAK
ncbi:PASTA domain-containing protein [Paludicola sp. MB14-C6]|uniref:PASTA domain-containing protein n=1 Tax=Paludihabitans sp. MB14-C6 TaxID=3070656 RepID=UPI0027DE0E2F|nr:PASTA domain-containing protein [Paludicola sp. MB14-C6]WMJ23231.1 PASTA domain-containing protein [Paludicola sp. MB14-C6]